MDDSHITTTPLETKWLAQKLHHPYINMKTSLCYIHRLYLLNITDITQLTQNCGTKLMTIQDIQRQYGPLTKIMHKFTKNYRFSFAKLPVPQPTLLLAHHMPPLSPSFKNLTYLYKPHLLNQPPYPNQPPQSTRLYNCGTKLNYHSLMPFLPITLSQKSSFWHHPHLSHIPI